MITVVGKEQLALDRRETLEQHIFLSTDPTERGNVNSGHRKMQQLIRHRLSAISLDLLDVAAYLYTADKIVQRPRTWVRELTFELPVREWERWQTCEELVTQAVARLSGDKITFVFTKRSLEEGISRLPELPEKKIERDCVVLFSGGLDSCTGVVQLLKKEKHPLLVSHSPSRIGGVQRRLAEIISIKMEQKDDLINDFLSPQESKVRHLNHVDTSLVAP
jgi:hypothetical protein